MRPSSVKTSEVARHIHQDCPGQKISKPKIIDREPQWFKRGVREAIHIRANKPDLNRDGGRFQLSHVWDTLIDNQVPRAR